MAEQIPTLAVVLAVHNRCNQTLSCLSRLYAQEELGTSFRLRVVVVDDGSHDGTSQRVAAEFSEVRIVSGDGNLYWCGGMRLGIQSTMQDRPRPAFLLWLNDDTLLEPNAVARLLSTYAHLSEGLGPLQIIVGSSCCPESGKLAYGGLVRDSWWHPFRYRRIEPSDQPASCDTMEGNCVLVPLGVYDILGSLDEHFTHGIGDTDYGLRANKAGCGVWVAPGYYGKCARNDATQNWDSAQLSMWQRFNRLRSVKGLPLDESRIFARRHGGKLWMLFWLMPIFHALFMPHDYRNDKCLGKDHD